MAGDGQTLALPELKGSRPAGLVSIPVVKILSWSLNVGWTGSEQKAKYLYGVSQGGKDLEAHGT